MKGQVGGERQGAVLVASADELKGQVVVLSEAIVSSSWERPLAVAHAAVGEGETEGGLRPRRRRRVSRIWVMEPAPRASRSRARATAAARSPRRSQHGRTESSDCVRPLQTEGAIVGLDVHAATIAVAVAESVGEVRSLDTIANRPDVVRRLVRKLGPADELRVCSESRPHRLRAVWQWLGLGVPCDVVAPSFVPVKAGDRVKTDRPGALKLAWCYRAGEPTPVWVPDARAGSAPRGRIASGRPSAAPCAPARQASTGGSPRSLGALRSACTNGSECWPRRGRITTK